MSRESFASGTIGEEYWHSMKTDVRTYVWIVPFLYGVLLFAAALYWLVLGAPFDTAFYSKVAGVALVDAMAALSPSAARAISALVREMGGNTGLVAGILIMAVSAFAFRRNEQWSWYVLWVLPLHSAIDLVTAAAYSALSPAVVAWDAGLIAAMLLALLLSSHNCLHSRI